MKTMRSWWVWSLSLLSVAACRPYGTPGTAAAVAAPDATCFAVAGLPDDDRSLADRVLLEFSDREGLYTLAGGLKPVSSDVRDLTFRVAPRADSAKLAELDRLRRVMGTLTCGDIGIFVQVFTATSVGRDSSTLRHATLVLYHRTAVARAVSRQRAFFASLGITPSADPRDVVNAVENAPRDARWRGYGYLFGYPDDAVDFFVRAGIEGDNTKQVVPRDFRRIETWYKAPESNDGPRTVSSFVYAVPKGAADSEGDRELRKAAAVIYAQYAADRAQWVRADSTGALALWRARIRR